VFAASQLASNAAQDETTVAPIVAPAAAPQVAPANKAAPVVVKDAAPVVDTPEKPGFTIQSKGTKEKTGEDNSTGSSITWVHSRNDEIK
jgi:cytoskeletal protein RodZ